MSNLKSEIGLQSINGLTALMIVSDNPSQEEIRSRD